MQHKIVRHSSRYNYDAIASLLYAAGGLIGFYSAEKGRNDEAIRIVVLPPYQYLLRESRH